MATYAVVCAAEADAVAAARLPGRLGQPVVLLLDTPRVAWAFACLQRGRPLAMGWAADWEPPADPAEYAKHRKEWDGHAADFAAACERPDAAQDLADVRNDPVPGRPRTSGEELLRQVVDLVGLPADGIGFSLVTHGPELLEGALPVEAAGAPERRTGLFARLRGRG